VSNNITIPDIILPDGDEWIARVREKAFENMKRYDGCSQVIEDAFMQEWGLHDPLATRSASAFLSGMLSSYTRVADGAEQIALFIKELHQKGELFRSDSI
jgi:hypothetical protein